MDNRSEVREFLASRRAKLSPSQAGLSTYGEVRRVPGLRRDEVARLAAVSVDYYIRLERGNLNGVSESVLDGVAKALQLDEAERSHLFHLARASATKPQQNRIAWPQRVRPGVRIALDAITSPAIVRNACLDIVASNRLGRALYSDMYAYPGEPANHARFVFFNPQATEFYPDWDRAANEVVTILRTESGRHPHDVGIAGLLGELSSRSDDFRERWAAHYVGHHYTGF
ncbi:helix-turn-helix transcriptional regulator, partial [Arthrobacter bambusae]|uniref:helix-turn-helix transcriptional regulator n=1 Tax=Arthrobacter bambusae TaxID=1338426 RepID=UPI001F5111D7